MCGGQKLCYQFVFGSQFTYMWAVLRSYKLGLELHLVCLPLALDTMQFYPPPWFPYVSLKFFQPLACSPSPPFIVFS